MRWMVVMGLFGVTACGSYPADAEGTLNAIKHAHVIRVGLIEGTQRSPNFSKVQSYLKQVSEDVGAKVEVRQGSAEALFAEIEQGSLDVAVGEIASDSPWLPDVAVVEPIAKRSVGHCSLGLSAIARNGENAWIMVLERHARDMKVKS
ncbi:hypothetical protein KFK14_19215 [Sphingobium phenoxybenzoativorans]|uniref:Uncharacterized protein n=1 Tax=Sphingobium phenoxybenzoativorans TaxID=1592790 RepID=A0A975Q0Q4_9SPHN|nr:hypothetical protein [Sphingobium phenoxybenzoativorans]QUT05110.1 hypothetical protein KFK14_19215 [Sphingobium phenoxybenzoativorans]